jgi:hypothetical protein
MIHVMLLSVLFDVCLRYLYFSLVHIKQHVDEIMFCTLLFRNPLPICWYCFTPKIYSATLNSSVRVFFYFDPRYVYPLFVHTKTYVQHVMHYSFELHSWSVHIVPLRKFIRIHWMVLSACCCQIWGLSENQRVTRGLRNSYLARYR